MIQDKLIKWYKENKRDLPFRNTDDPYKIWISEIMLQQTTVAAVIPYYERFINRFPTISSLS
ncbi:MAG TPA: A/G-specific adenine glycosylase, partial [Kandleria vitulina]|nr:A/G-specific adenine glycosylase [Kandleria vitulina]HAH75343.1 A/G-specific adenine glycosylase [Kandleria vitulina]